MDDKSIAVAAGIIAMVVEEERQRLGPGVDAGPCPVEGCIMPRGHWTCHIIDKPMTRTARTALGGTISDPPRTCPTCHRIDCPTLPPDAGDDARAACAAWCARRVIRRG